MGLIFYTLQIASGFDTNELNALVGVLLVILTAGGMIITAVQIWTNRKVDKNEVHLNDAEKLTSIALNSAETLRRDLLDAKQRTVELEKELQSLRDAIDGFVKRVAVLEHVYDDLVKRQTQFMLKLNLVETEVEDIIHGKINPDNAVDLVIERMKPK